MRDDPRRLKRDPAAPPELVRALEALRSGVDDAARLERVAEKLGPVLDAPPSAASVAHAARAAQYKLPALKLILAGLALIAPAYWMLREVRPHSVDPASEVRAPAVRAASAAAPGPAVREPAAPSPSAQATATAQGAEPVAASHAASQPNTGKSSAGARTKTPARVRAGASSGRAAPVEGVAYPSAAHGVHGVVVGPAAASERTVSESSASQAQPAPAATTPSPEPEAARERASAEKHGAVSVHTPSEAELLFGARKSMPSEPARALQLLTEHATRYPHGLLVPEREVLAIEALRSLGRTTAANARLRRFQERYPDSLHLKRLQR